MRGWLFLPFLLVNSGCWLFDPGRKNIDKGNPSLSLLDDSRPISIVRVNNRSSAVFIAHSGMASFCELAIWPQSVGANRPGNARVVSCSQDPHYSNQVTIDGLDPASVYWYEASFGPSQGDWKTTRKNQESASDETFISAQSQNSNIAIAKINNSFGTISVSSVFGYPGKVPKLSLGCSPKELDLQALAGKSSPSKIGWISVGEKKSENIKSSSTISMQTPNTVAIQNNARLEFDLNGTVQAVNLPKAPILNQASVSSLNDLALTRARLGSGARVEWTVSDNAVARWQAQNLDSEAYMVFDARVQGSVEGFSCVFEGAKGSGELPMDQLRKLSTKSINIQMKLVTMRLLSASNKLPILTSYEDSRRRVVVIK